MFIDSKNLRIFIYQEVIDMRCGFEKLLHFARDKMKNNVNQGHLYLFFAKKQKTFKSFIF
jgi:hypothetical protein